MSANNMITINKKTFVVREADVETGYGHVLGKGRNLEEAVEIAENAMKNEEVEYGIHFVNK
ncbi:MAG: hypothetical protein HYW63_02495 [Candidatus Levybacteria bacterium]|nr:hypothetical protein [Candidatus Levybacteria bacterium]